MEIEVAIKIKQKTYLTFVAKLLSSLSTPTARCSGALNASTNASTLTSPNYPNDYPNGVDCVWYITAPVGFHIWLNVTDLLTESHSSCGFDSLTLYSG